MAAQWALRYGATVTTGGVEFRVWAPRLRSLQVLIREEAPRIVPLVAEGNGDFAAVVEHLHAGVDYLFVTDEGRELPDPVSRWQPHGVHGASRVVDAAGFPWSDHGWAGIPLKDYIFYELHTGTFTPEGTFEGIAGRLPYLRDLGVTAIEVMPVAEFPGSHDWGYDGVGLFAPQSTYGGPDGLKALVDACHRQGMAVVLDVVYNHLGPEGNYLEEFAPFFTDEYKTPWGRAINYDGAESDGVQRHFINNALYWLTEYHIDGLRLDAIHGIFDFGAHHILQEIGEAFHGEAKRLGRQAWVIAESDLNDPRVIRPASCGYGLDAQWNDDFHHALHTALTKDMRGYFADFQGLPSLAKALNEGYVYRGQYSAYRKRRHGASSADRPGEQFVVFTQNHDQVANALSGSRASSLLSADRQRLAAAVLICSPFLPLFFMGQEYSETAGFYYFTDYGDPVLAEAVRQGRKQEAGAFLADGEFLDPQDAATFLRSKLNWQLLEERPNAGMLAWYRELLSVRRQNACLSNCRKDLTETESDFEEWLVLKRSDPSGSAALLMCNFSERSKPIPIRAPEGHWRRRLWSSATQYGGSGVEPTACLSSGDHTVEIEGHSAALYLLE